MSSSDNESDVSTELDSDLFYITDYNFQNSDEGSDDLNSSEECDEEIAHQNISTENENNVNEGEELGVAPFMFEPLAPHGYVENTDDESDETETDNIDDRNDRSGETSWCLCGECRVMESHEESICCKEIDVIPDDHFEGKITRSTFPVFLFLPPSPITNEQIVII